MTDCRPGRLSVSGGGRRSRPSDSLLRLSVPVPGAGRDSAAAVYQTLKFDILFFLLFSVMTKNIKEFSIYNVDMN